MNRRTTHFTDDQVREIRADSRTCKDIARDPKWWCNEDTIYRIRNRTSYKWVKDEPGPR